MSVPDFSRYNAPGVFTQAVAGPQIGVNSSAPRAVGIFGDTTLYRTDLETVLIPADVDEVTPGVSVNLRQTGIDPATLQVSNPVTGEGYVLLGDDGGDYEIVINAQSTTTSRDDTVTLKRVLDGSIPPNTSVQVSYSYTDQMYFTPRTFYDFDDVVDAYGPPFNSDGSIASPLTLSCQFAFLNGAERIIAVALDHPAGESPTAQNYTDALKKLEDIQDISIVIPATGDQAIFTLVKQHVINQSNNRRERRAILGLDGTESPIPSSQRMSAAGAIKSNRVVLLSPDIVTYTNPITNSDQALGGQYLAAGLAGLAVSLNPATPLTRKALSGFTAIPEVSSESQKNQEAQSGLLIVEQTLQGLIRVRHGLTTDPTNTITREWSIQGQEDSLSYRLRDFLDADGLIGQAINELSLVNVKASADSALQSLVDDSIIRGYTGLVARQMTNYPDIVEIKFTWQASVPLNYIVNRFSIDLSSGEVQASETSAADTTQTV